MRAALIALSLLTSAALAQEQPAAPLTAPLPQPNPLPHEPLPATEAGPSPAEPPRAAGPMDDAFSAFENAPDLGLTDKRPPPPVDETNPNRARYLPLVRKEAEEAGVPADLADAVAMVESNYEPQKRGTLDELGLMQITPAIARRLGVDGPAESLMQPELNIRLGVRHLAASWRQAGQDVCHTLMKYRFGLQSLDLTDEGRAYCKKALIYLASIDSNIGRAIEMPGLVRPEPKVTRERFDWQAHEARMKAIDKKWGGENFGIISP